MIELLLIYSIMSFLAGIGIMFLIDDYRAKKYFQRKYDEFDGEIYDSEQPKDMVIQIPAYLQRNMLWYKTHRNWIWGQHIRGYIRDKMRLHGVGTDADALLERKYRQEDINATIEAGRELIKSLGGDGDF